MVTEGIGTVAEKSSLQTHTYVVMYCIKGLVKIN